MEAVCNQRLRYRRLLLFLALALPLTVATAVTFFVAVIRTWVRVRIWVRLRVRVGISPGGLRVGVSALVMTFSLTFTVVIPVGAAIAW